MEAKLIVIGGKANKSEVRLKLPTTIGRSRKADLTISHPKVSRQHCQIFERDGLLVVQDNGSLNGTFIESNRITESILKPGDKLTVGPLTFVAVYEFNGSLPPSPPDPAELATPLIEPVELVEKTARVSRGATIVAKPVAAPTQAPAAETTPADTPQPATSPASGAEAEVEDFSWLTGDTEPAPPAAGPAPEASPPEKTKPGSATETDDFQWLQEAADADLSADEPAPLAKSESDSDEDALANPPTGEAQDLSWLDDAKDQPLDFSSFEGGGSSSPASEPSTPSAESGRTTIQEPGPTVMLPKRLRPDDDAPSQVSGGDETAMLQAESPKAEDLNFEADMPAESLAREEETQSAESADEEPEFPPIHADRPLAPVQATDKSGVKGWWPFAGKKKSSAAKPSPAEEKHEPEAQASEPSVAEPAFPPREPTASPATSDEDEALSQFFKSIK